MSIIWMEGFELNDYALEFEETAGINTGSGLTPALFGRSCGFLGNNFALARYAIKNLGNDFSEGLVSFAFAIDSPIVGSRQIFYTRSGASTNQVILYLNVDGTISVYRNTTLLATTPDPVITASDVRYRIELGFSISSSSGTIDLRVNDSQLINQTGLNTMNTSSTFNKLIFSNYTGNGRCYFDDIIFDTDKTAFRGDFTIENLYPNSDVSGYSIPSTGVNRWATIDEISQYSADDYNSFSGVGLDVYGLTNLTSNPQSIYGVSFNWIGRKSDTSNCSMRGLLYSGTGVVSGVNNAMNISAQKFRHVVEYDPNTSLGWTASGVNSLQLGIQRTY